MLPGGSIEQGESDQQALIRELKEETGIDYQSEDCSYLTTINLIQDNYPNRDNNLINRTVRTHYFLVDYKGLNLACQNLTESEKKFNFHLAILSMDELYASMNRTVSNPRNSFFVDELSQIIAIYKKQKHFKRRERVL